MYPFGRQKAGVSRKTRDVLLLAAALLLALNILQLVVSKTGSGSSGRTEAALISCLESDLSQARGVASQLVRTGGSNTTTHLSQVRQYLYGLSQAQHLYSSLFGSCPVSGDTISQALDAVSECEAQMLSGASIGTPLNLLWTHLDALSLQAQALR